MGRRVLVTEYGDDEACFRFQSAQPGGDDTRRELKSGEVEVRVRACGLSVREIEERSGRAPWMVLFATSTGESKHLPSVPGYEMAGTVSRMSPDCSQRIALGDQVVALVPATFDGACADHIILPEYLLVHKPLLVSWEDAAASLQAGVRAYTALCTAARLERDQTILVLRAAHADQHIALQLAMTIGAVAFATAETEDELRYLRALATRLPPHPKAGRQQSFRIIDTRKESMQEVVMAATNGLGVDVLLEPCYGNVTEAPISIPHAILLLAAQGCWLTSRNLQLDPPASQLLLLKGVTMTFVFEQTWLLSGAQHGKFMHIVKELMEKLASGAIRVHVTEKFALEKISLAYAAVQDQPVGKVVVTI